MPVTYLELENFKSYAGLQRIGPFHDFTCVVGPNGAGKSNLMDAISFILGVQSRDLRSQQMKDLVFRPPGQVTAAAARKLKASATLIYEDPYNDNREMRFTRTISAAGVGEYKVDGSVVSYKEYEVSLGADFWLGFVCLQCVCFAFCVFMFICVVCVTSAHAIPHIPLTSR